MLVTFTTTPDYGATRISTYTVEVKCNSLEYLIMEFIHRVEAAGRGVGVRPPREVESKGRQNCWKNEYNKPSFGQIFGGGLSRLSGISVLCTYLTIYIQILRSCQNSNTVLYK
jgi:hypothetical protein